MFVLPVDTDRRLKRRPVVNYILIALNVAVFLATMNTLYIYKSHAPALIGQPVEAIQAMFPVTRAFLWPSRPELWQFLSHAFLHLSWLHLFFNMLFLLVFGNAVEDRLGRLGYLAFYLAGAVVAGLLHTLIKPTPVIGASGAVAAVTAAYLVFFPLTYVRMTMIVYEFEVSSLIVILFFVGQDLFLNITGTLRTAYLAHLGGYGFGLLVSAGLLVTRVLPGEPYDLLHWLNHQRRRATFRRLARDKPVWSRPDVPSEPPRDDASAAPISTQQQALMRRRDAVLDAHRKGKLDEAATRYVQLLAEHPGQAMPQGVQLDVAATLMQAEQRADAAQAYELMLQTAPDYTQSPSVRLILGLLYADYLDRPADARRHLDAALPHLTGPDADHARDLLAKLPGDD